MNISEEEASRLIAEKKKYYKKDKDDFGLLVNNAQKGKAKYTFMSDDERDEFCITFERKGIQLDKRSKCLVGSKTIPLLRLDLGKPHRNPDGEEVGENHIHIYKEGFDDKWAYPIDENDFAHLDDVIQTFYDFLRYCNAEDFPKIQKGLFD